MGFDTAMIKARLKQAIKDNPKVNQKVVASIVGISKSYLTQILNNDKTGSFDLIIKIADAAGTSLAELIGNEVRSEAFPRASEIMNLPLKKRPWAIKSIAAESNGLHGWNESTGDEQLHENQEIPKEHRRYFDGEITEVDLYNLYDRYFKKMVEKLERGLKKEGL